MFVTRVDQIQTLVRDRRRALGLNQEAAAAMAGVSRKWVSEFERGKASADITLVFRLLNALDLRVEIARPGDVTGPPSGPPTVHTVDLNNSSTAT